MGRLQDKVALVTGASAGIGRATARLFAAEGAKLVVGARREVELVLRSSQMIQVICAKPKRAAGLRQAAVNHVSASKH